MVVDVLASRRLTLRVLGPRRTTGRGEQRSFVRAPPHAKQAAAGRPAAAEPPSARNDQREGDWLLPGVVLCDEPIDALDEVSEPPVTLESDGEVPARLMPAFSSSRVR